MKARSNPSSFFVGVARLVAGSGIEMELMATLHATSCILRCHILIASLCYAKPPSTQKLPERETYRLRAGPSPADTPALTHCSPLVLVKLNTEVRLGQKPLEQKGKEHVPICKRHFVSVYLVCITLVFARV